MRELEEVVDSGGDVPCLRPEADPDWWFSDLESHVRKAKEGCRVCPVVLLCDVHATAEQEKGVWGARSKQDRADELERAAAESPSADERVA